MAEATINPNLSHPSESIWYALATIAGEPKDGNDFKTIEENRHYWNGYMQILGKEYWDMHEDIVIPDALDKFTKTDRAKVESELESRGFNVESMQDAAKIDLSNLELPFIVMGWVVFLKPVDFSGSTFTDYAIFRGSQFYGSANFSNITVLGAAQFSNCVFNDESDFRGGMIYNPAEFAECRFAGDSDFNGITFSGSANFSGCTFNQLSDFNNAKFSAEANFSNCSL